MVSWQRVMCERAAKNGSRDDAKAPKHFGASTLSRVPSAIELRNLKVFDLVLIVMLETARGRPFVPCLHSPSRAASSGTLGLWPSACWPMRGSARRHALLRHLDDFCSERVILRKL